MNYLAHLFLSDDSAESIVGALLGDFVKGSLHGRYTEGIQRGIEMHRRVDSFTDSHRVVKQSKRRISPARRRFAGIIIDVFYDHFLAKNWADYSDESLSDFATRTYDALIEHREILPDRLQQTLPAMIAHNWLCSYKDVSVIDRVLNRMSQRIRRENTVAQSVEELVENYDEFAAEFTAFFPDLINYVEGRKHEVEKMEDLLLVRVDG